jgi:hypothetical protein
MARRYARLIGIEVRPVQGEAVRRLGIEQRESVSERGYVVCTT